MGRVVSGVEIGRVSAKPIRTARARCVSTLYREVSRVSKRAYLQGRQLARKATSQQSICSKSFIYKRESS